MVNLNSKQEALIARLHEADQRYRAAKVEEYARARREADERVLERLLARDVIAAEASLAGVPLRRLGIEGLGTSNAKTAKDAVEHGLKFIDTNAPVEEETTSANPNFEYVDDDHFRVTLTREEFQGWNPNAKEDVSTHLFTFREDGYPTPVDGHLDDTYGIPAVRAMMAPDRTWMKKARAWLEGRAA